MAAPTVQQTVEAGLASDLEYIQQCNVHGVVRDLIAAMLTERPQKEEIKDFIAMWATRGSGLGLRRASTEYPESPARTQVDFGEKGAEFVRALEKQTATLEHLVSIAQAAKGSGEASDSAAGPSADHQLRQLSSQTRALELVAASLCPP
eukprot:TRINITY_DN11048_c0_g2_i1.p1 TRINITY_DN11048_c0_g2~~TRINITY_DN11048_c0_g2_i1.p1  ORF type:complete len:149 (+),score=28.49 TRINITY_DN11048_c0_g2_i1:61-507(+)